MVIPSIEQFLSWIVVERCTILKLPSEWNIGAPSSSCFSVVRIIDSGWFSVVIINHVYNSAGNEGISYEKKKQAVQVKIHKYTFETTGISLFYSDQFTLKENYSFF